MSLVDCSNDIVKETDDMGLGVFSNKSFKKGDIIEKGIIRRVDTDGHKNPYLFTWSVDRDIWGFGSGCSTFYNTSLSPNCKMIRYYDEDRFEMVALCNIDNNVQLFHTYQSLEWRDCFKSLKV